MAQSLAHLEFELGSIPGSCFYSISVATLGKLVIHIASPVSQLQETEVYKKGVFGT